MLRIAHFVFRVSLFAEPLRNTHYAIGNTRSPRLARLERCPITTAVDFTSHLNPTPQRGQPTP